MSAPKAFHRMNGISELAAPQEHCDCNTAIIYRKWSADPSQGTNVINSTKWQNPSRVAIIVSMTVSSADASDAKFQVIDKLIERKQLALSQLAMMAMMPAQPSSMAFC